MKNHAERAEAFHTLHVKGAPLILYNIWDPGSAKAVAAAGAKALATGSLPVAMAHGSADGEKMPMDLALANFARIAQSVDLPVTLDFEGAYSTDPDIGATNIVKAIEAGAVGVNFEDQIIGGTGFQSIEDQSARIAAARAAIDGTGIRGFINARTDLFLKAMMAKEPHTSDMLAEAIQRASAYADAGADGFFAPGLQDIAMIEQLCAEVSLPVNIIALPGTPANADLAKVGVARISYGPVPYRQMTAWLTEQAKAVFDGIA
ncbi:MAG: isocitrate lyase/phosphoenolpyruvate mutase family protein [Pseudomonadota bacterium]